MSATAADTEHKRKFSDDYFEGNTKGVSPLRQTGEGLLKDIAIGVIGGGLASAILGRYSFVLGLGVAGYGHYSQNRLLSTLGLGMMASGTFYALTGKDQDNKKSVGEKVTERVGAFKSEMKRKLWLDYFEQKKGRLKNTSALETEPIDDLNGTDWFGQEPLMNATDEQETTDYFQTEVSDPFSWNDVPKLEKNEAAFLEKKVEQAIDQEMKFFLKNRQAITAHLDTESNPLPKKESTSKPEAKRDALQKEVEENFESHLQDAERKTETNKTASRVKPRADADDPEPQDLLF